MPSLGTLRRLCLASLVLGFVAPACRGEARAVEGHAYVVRTVTENGKPRELVAGTELTISFGTDGRFGASAGCNQTSGDFSIRSGKLVVSDVLRTEKACRGILEQEGWYNELLLASPTITVDGDKLVLESGGVRLELLDREVAKPDVALVGTKWQVAGILDGRVAMAKQWAQPATLAFRDDGTIAVDAGCNSGIARYSISGNEITVSTLELTEVACADADATELEAAVAGVLRGAKSVRWEVDVDRLSLRSGDRGLDLVAVPAAS